MSGASAPTDNAHRTDINRPMVTIAIMLATLIVSIDGEKDALQAIIDGKMLASVECNPKFGPKAFETAKRYAKGEKIEPWVINPDRFFDASNAKEMIADSY